MLGPMWSYYPARAPGVFSRPGQVRPSGTLQQTVEAIYPGFIITTPRLHAGDYYPRMSRDVAFLLELGQCLPRVADTPYVRSFIGSLQQVETLCDDLLSLFRIAHPDQDNLSAYGGAIRDLIILACTEVEAQWKGILQANGVTARNDRYTTNDYVRLLPAMKLAAYRMALLRYPGLPEMVPFGDWNITQPTKSLSWYNVYNLVKHDREANFKDATLGNAITAVAACVVMLAAQYGYETLSDYGFKNPFRFKDIPLRAQPTFITGLFPAMSGRPSTTRSDGNWLAAATALKQQPRLTDGSAGRGQPHLLTLSLEQLSESPGSFGAGRRQNPHGAAHDRSPTSLTRRRNSGSSSLRWAWRSL